MPGDMLGTEVALDRVEMVIVGGSREVVVGLHTMSQPDHAMDNDSTHGIGIPGLTAHGQVDPWAHQQGTARHRVPIVAQVEHRRHAETAARAVTAKDDVLGRDLEVVDEAEIAADGVVQGTRESSLGG
jgi:hypothetical protein